MSGPVQLELERDPAEQLADQPCSDLITGACPESYIDQLGEERHCCMTVGHDGNHMVRMRDKGDGTWLYSWPNRSELTKETAPCCVSRALPDGRLPLGWCSPGCLRRPIRG
jgi:hypothetical protein